MCARCGTPCRYKSHLHPGLLSHDPTPSAQIERRWKVLHHERNTCALTEIRNFGPPSPRVFHPLSRLVEILESLLFVPEHQQSLGKIHQAPDPRRPVRGPRSPFDTLFADADCLGVVTHCHVIQAEIRSDVGSTSVVA